MKKRALGDIESRRISLAELSGQLSGFIGDGDEVKDAILKGLHSNVNQLIRLLQASCGDGKCNCNINNFSDDHLKNLQEKFTKYDKIATKIDSLKKQKDEKSKAPQGAPPVSDAEIDSLTREIKNLIEEIFSQSSLLTTQITTVIEAVQRKITALDSKKNEVDKLQSQVNELKKKIDAKKNNDDQLKNLKNELEARKKALKIAQDLFPEKESKSLDSHQKSMSSLKSLDKLCQHCDEVSKINKNHDGNCAEILKNLTEGLEKFLGYEKGNYTGEGIVYSDLDRLCDGVMSFLHGVLSGVQDDDNVTTYDTDTLKNVIDTLHNSVGKGRQAFGNAVSQVEGKTNKVTEGLSSLIGVNYYNQVNEQEGKTLIEQWKTWKSTLTSITRELSNIKNTPLNELDSTLKTRVLHEMKPITTAVTMLLDSAGNETLRDQVSVVDRTLAEEYTNIHNAMEALKDEQMGRIKAIRQSLTDAQKLVANQLGNDIDSFRNKVLQKFNEIQTEVSKVYGTLEQKKIALELLLKEAETHFSEISTGVGKEGNRSASIYHNWGDLKQQIEDTVSNVAKNAGSYGSLVAIVTGIQEYAEKFRDDNSGRQNFDTIVGTWIKSILESEAVKGALAWWVKYYKDKFTGTKLSGITERTIKNGSDTKLRDAITSAIKKALEQEIAKAGALVAKSIKETEDTVNANKKIDVYVSAVKKCCKQFATEIGGKLQEGSFSSLFGKISESISNNSDLSKSESGLPSNATDDLRSAILSILSALSNIAMRTSAQLGNFANTAKMENVEKAIETIKNIGEQFGNNGTGGTIDRFLQKVIPQIKALGTLLENSKSKLPEEVEKLKEILDKLNNMSKDIDDGKIKTKREDAGALVLKLQNELNGQLETIRQDLDHADAFLQTTINALEKAISDAFKKLYKEVRKIFCKQKLADLEAFKCLVEKQKSEIENTITLDSMSGVKGLMNLMETQNDKIFDILIDDKFNNATKNVKEYLHEILLYTSSQSRSRQVDRLKQQLDKLLSHLKLENPNKQYHFDYTFTTDLAALNDAITALTPKQFNGHKHPELLDALTAGAKRLAGELGKQYVNRYSGLKWADIGEPDREKCAKVLLTSLYTVNTNVNKLHKFCVVRCKFNKINKSTELGIFLSEQGYDVSNKDKQNGELHDGISMTGGKIYKNLESTIDDADQDLHLPSCQPKAQNKFNVLAILECLVTHLNQYNQVSHMSTLSANRHPCSVKDMLSWLSGLPHNHIYNQLKDHITNLFKVPDKSDPSKKILQPIEAHPSSFSDDKVHRAIKRVASRCQTLICTIAGHGDALTTYGCDFASNALQLQYPSNPAACFDTLVDLLRRLYSPLKFLQIQCKYSARDFGWRDCQYGNGVEPSNWQCKDHPRGKANEQPNSKPACRSACQPTCEPTCQPTSPLMSYLNDCLPGHLPHQLTTVGCSYKCVTCSSGSRNMPCLIPLGFRIFSGSTKTGKDICLVLNDMCGRHGVFTSLYSMLTCITVPPPQTLCDIFTFYCSLTQSWKPMLDSQNTEVLHPIQKAICKQIIDGVTCKYSDAAMLLRPCRLLHESSTPHAHTIDAGVDLKYLTGCNENSCGGFMQPLNYAGYSTLAPKYADKYLSYLVYSCPQLQKFLEEFKKVFCDISCYNSGCSSCVSSDGCKVGKHGAETCECRSIKHCKGVMSAFYKCGFMYADAVYKGTKKCHILIKAIESILKSKLLKNFLEAIDDFMFCVRKNFIWTLLALWSLSLLYLLHIAVVRLDVLRIRSHLRSPSSHRIAAQSLLAAARVKALANVKYFSP
ncbi:hypothetical protein, conserved [Babesia ovata]|uniref:C3H1-type domain-containing protein n=1 Tax=Babesia ovata TaxID=189622 RepID=A0A2H6KK93_9APIC|nr:uncharacterized protein BOVATA_049060 [Babesia ovata]GBE63413.1 hypothetical protein, conserved [Babesia ovata]